jgi:hypothetical protein
MVSTLVAYAIMELGMSYAVATFAVNFALSLIITRVFAENPEQQQDMGVRQQVPPSAVNAIPIVYGNAYMGGTFVDAVLTTDQKTMYYVLAISSISPNGQFTFDTADMYYGDRKITFDVSDLTKVVSLTDEAGNVDTKISGNLYINLYTSTTGGTITSANGASAPSTVMGGADIAVGQRWTGTRQMNGLGFAIVKLIYNRDADTTQLQPITFKVAHTLNGTGVAKAGDVWYDYMTNAVYGGAVDAAFVNSTSATTLNAYGDQNITFTNSSGNPATQPRYRINGVLDAGQSVLSNVDRIVSACDSWMTYNAALGQWSVVINKAESTAYAFNDNNIIGEIRVSATDITSSINQIEARFPFKENRDQAAFVNIETPSGLLYPNEPVNKYSITYDLVNDSVQAHYLANRLLEQAREDLIVSFSTTYYGIQVDAGDVVSVTNTDYGWNAKLFRVMKVNEASLPDGSLGASLEMSEYNAQVYDDFDITQFTPIPNSGLASVSYFSPLAAPTVTGFPSATFPHFDVQVFVPTTGRVLFGNLFYTLSASPSASDWKLLANASTSNSQPVTNNTYYTFADLSLGAGTYYFAYLVGNEISQSILSPISASFVWSPVGGSTGPTGATGPTGTGTTGATGLAAITAYKQQSQSLAAPTFTTPTSGSAAPSGWSLSAPSVSVGQVLWYIQGKYNSSTITIDGVAPNTTAWTGPVAASIFQDIRSDNWNGSNPPVFGTTGTYGTAGYYIQQSTGDVFFNNGIFRANINTSGDAVFKGDNTTTTNIPIYDSLYYIDYSVFGDGTTTASLGNVRAGVLGTGNSNGSIVNAGVIGYASNPSFVVGGIGVGVIGSGYNIGGYFSTYISSGIALICTAASSAYVAFQIQQGKFNWGAYSIPQPTGSTTTFLRNDGTWATPSGGGSGTVTSVSGTGTVSGLSLSGTVTTSGNLTLGGTLSVTQSDLIASAPSSAYYLSGSGWNSVSPIMTAAITNSGTATVSGNNLNILGSTSTGIVGAYVGTSGSGSVVTIDVRTTSPSDVRLKEEIADSDLGLAFVKKLRPVSYKLKADSKHQKGYGFIADEVDQIIESGSSLVYFEPDWKVGEEKGFKTIHYPSYIAVLTKAIQELSAQVEELKKQIPKV